MGEAPCGCSPCPQINIGREPYVMWWATIWGEGTRMVDLTSVLVLARTNSAARLAERGGPRLDDMGDRTFLKSGPPTSATWCTCTRSQLKHTPTSRGPHAPASKLLPAVRQWRWLRTTIGVAPSYLTTMPPSSSPSLTQWPC